jgi:hypothetical protein
MNELSMTLLHAVQVGELFVVGWLAVLFARIGFDYVAGTEPRLRSHPVDLPRAIARTIPGQPATRKAARIAEGR